MTSKDIHQMTDEEYAHAWLQGEIAPVNFRNGSLFPPREAVMRILREEPELANKFISTNVDRRSYDVLILEKVENGYDVYYTDRGVRGNLVHFDDLWSALDRYLLYMGLR